MKLLANSGKFQSSDLAEKGIMLLFNLTLWDIKKMNFDSLDEVTLYIKFWAFKIILGSI